jgi:hypothetical protein
MEQAVFIDRVCRLCRLGPEARAAAIQPLSGAPGLGRVDRTCIDGGGSLMLTLAAPLSGPLTVGIASALPDRPAPNARLWQRWDVARPGRAGRSLIFGQPGATDWQLASAERCVPPGKDAASAELFSRGQIYMTTKAEPGTGRDWISVGLFRNQSPRQALAAMRQPRIWPALRTLIADLLGRAVSDRARPWSIAVPAGGAGDRVRIGTTLWARFPEQLDKERRLSRQIGELGHDRDLVSGLYHYTRQQNEAARGVGVAAEFDFGDGDLRGAHYTLRVPPLRGNAGILKETVDGQD